MNDNFTDPSERRFRPDSELSREELYERERKRLNKRDERARKRRAGSQAAKLERQETEIASPPDVLRIEALNLTMPTSTVLSDFEIIGAYYERQSPHHGYPWCDEPKIISRFVAERQGSEADYRTLLAEMLAHIEDLYATAQQIIAVRPITDREDFRKAAYFVGEYGQHLKRQTIPVVEKKPLPPGASPKAIAELEAAKLREAARKAAMPTYEQFLASTGKLWS
jgi:hypothetical protein